MQFCWCPPQASELPLDIQTSGYKQLMPSHLSKQPFLRRLPVLVLILIASLLGAIAAPELHAQASQAAGIVIFKSALDDPQHYDGKVFKSMKDLGGWLRFEVGLNKPIDVEKGFIIDVVEFDTQGGGNVLTMNILNDSDAQQIAAFRDHLKKQTAPMPKLANLVKQITSLLENSLSLYGSGNVRKDGRWINKLTSEHEQAEKMKSALVIAGVTYINPRFISSKDETIAFVHDGGIAKIPFKKLDEKSRALLASTFKLDPAVFISSSAVSSGPADALRGSNPGDLMTKMSKIIFPTIEFQDATIDEAIEYMRIKSREFDTFTDASGVKGVNIIMHQGNVSSNAAISLDLKNVPMLEALRFITDLAQMKFRIEAHAVLVLPLSEDGSTAMTGTPANSNSSQPIASASNRPPPQTGPRIPLLPATMAVEAIGSGNSEREALFDAQFNAVAAALKDHVSNGAGDWISKVTIANIGDDSARTTDDYRKIAMKSGSDSVRVIIKTNITREKLVPILLKLGFVE
jgi:hypothetical protein